MIIREKIEQVYIPESVSKIESGAFANCDKLKEIEIPCYFPDGGLVEESFKELNELNKITVIPSNITSEMGRNTNMPWYKTENEGSIDLVVADGVTRIGTSFADQSSIKTAKIATSVKYIGEWAFSGAIRINKN